MGRAFLVEQRGFGEVVAGAGAGVWINAGQLGIAVRGKEGKNESEDKPGPHLARRGLAA